MSLLLRATAAFLLCPGAVAGLVPLAWVYLGGEVVVVNNWGLLPLATGLCGLLWCVRDFVVVGRGTLAPWDPPQYLVTIGLYRFSRNPMYVSVSFILAGWALLFELRPLLVYALAVMSAFALRVTMHEEPWLQCRYGMTWTDYRRRVRRWL